jgi:hypothetical protein
MSLNWIILILLLIILLIFMVLGSIYERTFIKILKLKAPTLAKPYEVEQSWLINKNLEWQIMKLSNSKEVKELNDIDVLSAARKVRTIMIAYMVIGAIAGIVIYTIN